MQKIRWLWASAHADTARAKDDYYATPPEAVAKLLEKETFQEYIFEPACGEGHISRILEEQWHKVFSSDIKYRGYGSQWNFFDYVSNDSDIITNPPYNQALEFIQHAIKISEKGVKIAMLLRIQFLESAKRYEFFKQFPPKKYMSSPSESNVPKMATLKTFDPQQSVMRGLYGK